MILLHRTRVVFAAKRASHRLPILVCALAFLINPLTINSSLAQQQNKRSTETKSSSSSVDTTATPQLTRSTTRHETRRFGYGSTLTVLGAPAGSVSIEAWPRSEVDITADIEIHADTEADLARLAAINNFLLDEDSDHLRIITTGTHDKVFMRRAAKSFPKNLLAMPWKIDYRIRVPVNTDLEINMGRGTFNLAGVDGSIRLTALESDAALTLTGGLVIATIGRGAVNVKLTSRSWRGAGADIRVATGDLTIELPANFNADINADVLRSGRIENAYTLLAPRNQSSSDAQSTGASHTIKARAGAGGATLAFTVGDGTLRIKPAAANKEQ